MSLSEGVYNSTLTGNLSHSHATAGRFSMEWRAPSAMSMAIFALTVLLGVPGNGSVIWVTSFKMKSKAHTMCFLNLAAADLIFCLSLPVYMLNISGLLSLEGDNTFYTLSSLFSAITLLNALASVYLLCLISIYRCLAVKRPVWFQQHLSLTLVRETCFVAWVITTAISLLVFFPQRHFDVVYILPAFSFVSTLVIMIICNAVVGWRLQGERFAKSRKPIRMIMIAVAAFVICWLPLIICILLPNDSKIVPLDWYMFTEALASFNSALNSLIYVFAGSVFRQVFKRSLFASLQLAFTEHERQGEIENRNPTCNRND
ncbi:C3a anaphylatoxin chemotactic receptor-like [Hypanus sabinus]|uniref:C3a anaphylatoxin chemotactic receptor-like n=1 Tax=Hypanus sabinus TaxID=79690 RepID=UPI0028C40DB2|nr:C3a anaphylatoxin chemotactic receptor-like [Hypanus sabinus]